MPCLVTWQRRKPPFWIRFEFRFLTFLKVCSSCWQCPKNGMHGLYIDNLTMQLNCNDDIKSCLICLLRSPTRGEYTTRSGGSPPLALGPPQLLDLVPEAGLHWPLWTGAGAGAWPTWAWTPGEAWDWPRRIYRRAKLFYPVLFMCSNVIPINSKITKPLCCAWGGYN